MPLSQHVSLSATQSNWTEYHCWVVGDGRVRCSEERVFRLSVYPALHIPTEPKSAQSYLPKLANQKQRAHAIATSRFDYVQESHAENNACLVGTQYTVEPKHMLPLRLFGHPCTGVLGSWPCYWSAEVRQHSSINRVAGCRLTHGYRNHDIPRAIRQENSIH